MTYVLVVGMISPPAYWSGPPTLAAAEVEAACPGRATPRLPAACGPHQWAGPTFGTAAAASRLRTAATASNGDTVEELGGTAFETLARDTPPSAPEAAIDVKAIATAKPTSNRDEV